MHFLNNVASSIGWAFIIVVSSLIAYYSVIITADFIGRYIACRAFLKRAHWLKPERPRWQHIRLALELAHRSFVNPDKTITSQNAYMVELDYKHPFKWRIINHWDNPPDPEPDAETDYDID